MKKPSDPRITSLSQQQSPRPSILPAGTPFSQMKGTITERPMTDPVTLGAMNRFNCPSSEVGVKMALYPDYVSDDMVVPAQPSRTRKK